MRRREWHPQPNTRLAPEDYLEIERRATHKSEYFDGEVFAMSGGAEQHNLITVNVSSSLHSQLRATACAVYSSDQRVKVTATGLYTYSDITVVCGDAVFDDKQQDTLLNPTVIVEVVSKSTGGYDRNEKFAHYRRIESLAEYLLIAQARHHVEHYVRQPSGDWLLSETDSLQANVFLPSIRCTIALADVYEKVEIRGIER